MRPRNKSEPIPSHGQNLLESYAWSSHRTYSGRCRAKEVPQWLSLEWLWYFGESRNAAQREYRRQVAESFGRCVSGPWEKVQGGLVLGGERLWERVKAHIDRSGGQEEIVWTRRVSQAQRLKSVEEFLATETDRRVQIWACVRLGGERLVDVAARYGFRDGSGVYRVVERLEALRAQDKSLGLKLRKLESRVHQPRQP